MNAHIESFHRILQDDCLSRYDFGSYSEAYEAVTEFIQFYNERRIHLSIQDLAADDFYKQNLILPIPIKALRV
jgi:putative transposase